MKSKKLKFNKKNHTYSVGKKKLIPVTTLISKYKNEFDEEGMSEWIATVCNKGLKQLIKLGFVIPTEEFKDRLEKTKPVNKTMVKKIWHKKRDEASEHGTRCHNALEEYILRNKVDFSLDNIQGKDYKKI